MIISYMTRTVRDNFIIVFSLYTYAQCQRVLKVFALSCSRAHFDGKCELSFGLSSTRQREISVFSLWVRRNKKINTQDSLFERYMYDNYFRERENDVIRYYKPNAVPLFTTRYRTDLIFPRTNTETTLAGFNKTFL